MTAKYEVWNLTRHKGKPTSGRFVYKSRSDDSWYWQCDMCHDYEHRLFSHRQAFEHALNHANNCPHVCTNNRSFNNDRPPTPHPA